MEIFVTSYDQVLRVHDAGDCAMEHCVIHNPSDHSMINFPLYWRADRAIFERICEHGVGHPDPDHMAFIKHAQGERVYRAEGIHGCDGCCKVKS